MASYGEINFVVIGVIMQLISVATESVRLSLVQILLQRRGLSLNPITTLYYIAPASFAFLSIPWWFIESSALLGADKVSGHTHWPPCCSATVLEAMLTRCATMQVTVNPWVLISNAAAAFALNLSVFLLIGKTSALTMNVAGVIKDWLLIGLSVLIFQAQARPSLAALPVPILYLLCLTPAVLPVKGGVQGSALWVPRRAACVQH